MGLLKLRNGVKMPIMSAGTWQYSVQEARKTVEAALAAGFSHIDTAYDYMNQQGVAPGLENAIAGGRTRESIFVTTKVPGCGLQNVSAVTVELLQCLLEMLGWCCRSANGQSGALPGWDG